MAVEQAEALALRALAFLAGDEERFHRFLLSTGATADDVQQRAAEPEFLSGVIDHLLTDEALLVAFAEDAALEPSSVAAARYRLPGAVME
jgi:hypothetical protein